MRDGTVEHFPGGQGHRQLGRRNHRRRSRRRRRRSHADVGGDPKWWQFGYSEMILFFLYNFKTTESCGAETGYWKDVSVLSALSASRASRRVALPASAVLARKERKRTRNLFRWEIHESHAGRGNDSTSSNNIRIMLALSIVTL